MEEEEVGFTFSVGIEVLAASVMTTSSSLLAVLLSTSFNSFCACRKRDSVDSKRLFNDLSSSVRNKCYKTKSVKIEHTTL